MIFQEFIHRKALVFCGAAAVMFCGCADSGSSTSSRTIAAHDLNRDTKRARELTVEADKDIDQNKWPDAEQCLMKAVTADVTFGPAHNNLGSVYLHEGNLYQAAWEFQYASKLMPYQPEPKNNLGLALERAGKMDDAVEFYDQALKMEPDNPEFLGNEARARLRRGDRDEKLHDMLKKLQAIDMRPQWQSWAREKLVLFKATTTTQPETLP